MFSFIFLQMLQTVPSATHNSDSFAAYAENFDLSLLPMDGDCDALDVQSQFLSIHNTAQNLMYSNIDIKPSFQRSITPDEYIPTTIASTLFDNHTKTLPIKHRSIPENNRIVAGQQQHSIAHNGISLQEYHQTDLQAYNNTIGSLPLSPPQDQFVTIFPPSPSPSIEYGNSHHLNQLMIKQEHITSTTNAFGLYPPSPPDSNGAPSPIGHLMIGDIKTEPYEIGPEPCLDLSTFFGNQFVDNLDTTAAPNSEHSSTPISVLSSSPALSVTYSTAPMSTISSTIDVQQQHRKDHQLLREYLQDTTFQRKHNLKPLALESLFIGDAWGARNDIEPVISLALEHARKDINDTCLTLNISAGKFLYLISLSFFNRIKHAPMAVACDFCRI